MTRTKGQPKVPKAERKPKAKKEEEEGELADGERGVGGHGGGTVLGSGVVLGRCSGGEDLDFCVDCGRAVLTTQQGLKCDGCGFWHHAGCERVAEEVYGFLCNHSEEESILWYCKKCVNTCKKMTTMMMMMNEHQQQLEDKVKDLANAFDRKLDELKKELSKKMDLTGNEYRTAGDNTQKRVEDKLEELSRKMESSEREHKVAGDSTQKLVEEKIEGLVDSVRQNMEMCSREEQEELEEIRRRRANIIMHGVKESMEGEFESRMKEDEGVIVNLLHDIGCDEVSVCSAVRLGKRSPDPVAKPRPLKIVAATEEQKSKILRLAKNLRGLKQWEKVFIHQDLTMRQREKRQQLVRELKDREAAGEKNLMIVNSKIVVRRQRTEQSDMTVSA